MNAIGPLARPVGRLAGVVEQIELQQPDGVEDVGDQVGGRGDSPRVDQRDRGGQVLPGEAAVTGDEGDHAQGLAGDTLRRGIAVGHGRGQGLVGEVAGVVEGRRAGEHRQLRGDAQQAPCLDLGRTWSGSRPVQCGDRRRGVAAVAVDGAQPSQRGELHIVGRRLVQDGVGDRLGVTEPATPGERFDHPCLQRRAP
jgi:hypothetical protein